MLLVDDDRDWLEMLTEELGRKGYAVRPAASGTQALSLLESFIPDVIVTDLRMPLMNGESFISTLRTRRQAAPIIVVTGESSRLQSPQLEAVFDVITKPVSLDRLLSAVAAAAARSAEQPAGANR